MEVILLWLDDLDDLVCASAQITERLRWPGLKAAFVATLSLALAPVAALPEVWWPLAASIALGGLLIWALGSTLMMRQAPAMATPRVESAPAA